MLATANKEDTFVPETIMHSNERTEGEEDDDLQNIVTMETDVLPEEEQGVQNVMIDDEDVSMVTTNKENVNIRADVHVSNSSDSEELQSTISSPPLPSRTNTSVSSVEESTQITQSNETVTNSTAERDSDIGENKGKSLRPNNMVPQFATDSSTEPSVHVEHEELSLQQRQMLKDVDDLGSGTNDKEVHLKADNTTSRKPVISTR